MGLTARCEAIAKHLLAACIKPEHAVLVEIEKLLGIKAQPVSEPVAEVPSGIEQEPAVDSEPAPSNVVPLLTPPVAEGAAPVTPAAPVAPEEIMLNPFSTGTSPEAA